MQTEAPKVWGLALRLRPGPRTRRSAGHPHVGPEPKQPRRRAGGQFSGRPPPPAPSEAMGALDVRLAEGESVMKSMLAFVDSAGLQGLTLQPGGLGTVFCGEVWAAG